MTVNDAGPLFIWIMSEPDTASGLRFKLVL